MKRTVCIALAGLFLAGCGASRAQVSESDVTAAAVCTQLSSPACRSPDGAWSVTTVGKGVPWVRHNGSGGMAIFPPDAGVGTGDSLVWAKPHILYFADNYRLFRLDPVARKRTLTAGWSDFVVSPRTGWVAGWAYSGGHAPETVGVLSPDGKTCLAVPHGSNESDEAAGFTRDGKSVVVKRSHFDADNGDVPPLGLFAYEIDSLPPSKRC